jgi:hypothetical protein
MRNILEEQLKIINEIVNFNYLNVEKIGVHKGLAGLSLFKFYNSKYWNNITDTKIGHEILTECVAKIDNEFTNFDYCEGAAGFGWVLDHLEQENFIESDNDSFLSQFDQYIYSTMKSSLNAANYDFLYGAIGNALYFLNRYKNTKKIRLKEKYKAILMEFIFLLEKISVKEGDGSKWFYILTKPESKNCNLGLCHGVSSIIAFLTKLHNYDTFKEHVTPLLQRAIKYLVSFKNKNDDAFSLFPNFSNNNHDSLRRSRLAWCYGDLGIGITLLRVSKQIEDNALKILAISILKHAAKRRTDEETMMEGTSLCHGIYGVVKIFNKAYLVTGDEIFKEAAEYWMQEGLNATIYKNGVIDRESWKSSIKSLTLLDGACGIGLVILDYLTVMDSNWDECLLIN